MVHRLLTLNNPVVHVLRVEMSNTLPQSVRALLPPVKQTTVAQPGFADQPLLLLSTDQRAPALRVRVPLRRVDIKSPLPWGWLADRAFGRSKLVLERARVPGSREAAAQSLAEWPGSIILVSHDPDFVRALRPDRALLMPDGHVDHWSDDLLDMVALA